MTAETSRSSLGRWTDAASDAEGALDMDRRTTHQVVLAGSMSALRVMCDLAAELERSGVKAVVPSPDDDPTAWTVEAIDALKRRASREHISHIRDDRTKALLVANLDRADNPNYIGPNTFAEIAIAFADDRPVYLLQGIPSQYEDELRAWGVHCLFGDVDRMVREVAPQTTPQTTSSPASDREHSLSKQRVS